MFRLVPQDGGRGPLLKSDHPLTSLDFRRISERLGIERQRARKRGFVAARRTDLATSGTGDWLVTTLDNDREVIRDSDGRANTTVVAAERFEALFTAVPDVPPKLDGNIFERRIVLEALRLTGAYDIVAPWGERQQAPRGWLLLDGNDVYGSSDDLFSGSYVVLPPPVSEGPWT